MVTADKTSPQKLTSPGEITPGNLYTIQEVRRRLGWTLNAYHRARRAGLPVRYMGKRGYVGGSEVIEFILTNGTATKLTKR